jgi:hypothetical protein
MASSRARLVQMMVARLALRSAMAVSLPGVWMLGVLSAFALAMAQALPFGTIHATFGSVPFLAAL